ncbi:hypothetical protein CEXT_63581 [Caerostris extrusa]|uniref:Histone H2A n=1 Tax=Caerostris extrusa TaxID=172846 RepID=A0AAV4MFF6_CAEEX|nr:hypothetical protein CEXT_63581 [Caerostris extrusa]
MEDYLKALWATARQVTKKRRRKVVTKHIMSALYDRAQYHGAILSNQVPIHCSLLMEDYLKNLWANARRVTKDKRRKVVTKHDIKSVLYKRASSTGWLVVGV